jgi:hypothetical protein
VVTLARQCPAWQLIYSDLGDALARLDDLWPSIVQGHAARAAQAQELALQEQRA